MDEQRSSNRSKRQKPPEDGFWECSVCTYRNSPEAYKCDMCDIRKGTSTRKPRLNSQLVAQQAAQQFVPAAPPAKRERNSTGLELNSDFDFSDNSNQGSNSHIYEEPLSNDHDDSSFNQTLNTSDTLAEIVIKQEKQEKEEKEKPEKHIKHEKQTKPEKKPKKVNRVPKAKKTDKLERLEEKMSVTVNNVTVIITDYIPKTMKKRTSVETNNHVDNSDNSSVSGGSNCAGEDLVIDNNNH